MPRTLPARFGRSDLGDARQPPIMSPIASLATAVHLALHLKRPLFPRRRSRVGKTEIAKVLATALKRRLIRLQLLRGLDNRVGGL